MCNIYSHRELTRRESELSHTYTHRPPKTRTYTPPPTHTHSYLIIVVQEGSCSLSPSLVTCCGGGGGGAHALCTIPTLVALCARRCFQLSPLLLHLASSPRRSAVCGSQYSPARVFYNKQTKKKQPPARDTYQCVRITQCDKGGRRGAGRERERGDNFPRYRGSGRAQLARRPRQSAVVLEALRCVSQVPDKLSEVLGDVLELACGQQQQQPDAAAAGGTTTTTTTTTTQTTTQTSSSSSSSSASSKISAITGVAIIRGRWTQRQARLASSCSGASTASSTQDSQDSQASSVEVCVYRRRV